MAISSAIPRSTKGDDLVALALSGIFYALGLWDLRRISTSISMRVIVCANIASPSFTVLGKKSVYSGCV